MSDSVRPGSSGFSRHAIVAKSSAAAPPTSALGPSAPGAGLAAARKRVSPPIATAPHFERQAAPSLSTYTPTSSFERQPAPSLSGYTPTPHFERQPAPTLSTYVPAAASPFIFHGGASSSPPAVSSVSTSHSVKLPRDSPLLPRGATSHSSGPATLASLARAEAKSSPVVSPIGGGDVDMHAVERAMLDDIGLFRERRSSPNVTVEALLRDRREGERLQKARSKDMNTINSILPTPAAPEKSAAALDMSLITTLTQRLSTLEKIASKQAKSLGTKDVLICDLQARLRAVEHSQDAALLYQLQKEAADSKAESEALKRQLAEMETFLTDYGLVWVGFRAGATTEEQDQPQDEATQAGQSPSASPRDTRGGPSPDGSSTTTSSPSAPTVPTASSTEIYFDVPQFLASVQELNSLAHEGSALRIHTSPAGVTKFLPPPALDLVLYRDGMWFRGGPLRSWSLPAARDFIKDVQEGYFPYELKDEYPDGVALAVVDKAKHYCLASSGSSGADTSASKFQPFAGKGNRLEDGKVVEPSVSPSTSPVTTSLSAPPLALTAAAPPRVPLDAFLAKLPEKAVLKSGKLVDVRGEIRNMLSPSPGPATASPSPPPSSSPSASPAAISSSGQANATLVDTPALRLIRAREAEVLNLGGAAAAASLPPLPPIATLRVQLDPSDARPPLLLKLLYETPLTEVRALVDAARAPSAVAFDLRTNYPARGYSADDVRSILEAGLTPNANMFVRNRRPLSGYRSREPVPQPLPDESWSTPAAPV